MLDSSLYLRSTYFHWAHNFLKCLTEISLEQLFTTKRRNITNIKRILLRGIVICEYFTYIQSLIFPI